MEDGHDRLVLVFRSGEDYVFTMGESATTLSVRLSSAAVSLFKSHGIGADDLASLAAQWAWGRHMTRVDLAVTSDHFTELYLALSVYLDNGLQQVPSLPYL
jgi:hypothetical protein